MSPEEFIPIAEEKGLILDIGDRVLELVAQFVRLHNLEQTSLQYIEVNLSGIQILSHGIEERLQKILRRYNVEPSFINLEITETATTDAQEQLVFNVEKLHHMGFSFSMDDFGSNRFRGLLRR